MHCTHWYLTYKGQLTAEIQQTCEHQLWRHRKNPHHLWQTIWIMINKKLGKEMKMMFIMSQVWDKEKISVMPGFEPITFRTLVGLSNHWAREWFRQYILGSLYDVCPPFSYIQQCSNHHVKCIKHIITQACVIIINNNQFFKNCMLCDWVSNDLKPLKYQTKCTLNLNFFKGLSV